MQSVKFSKNYSCSDCQQHCCRVSCRINSKQLIASSFVDKPPVESHGGCCNEELRVISMLSLELHWSLFICSSQLLYLSIFIPWTTLLKSDQPTFFQCFGDLNLNQKRLEQYPGLGGPIGSVCRVFIKLEKIFLYSPTEYKNIREWYQATFFRITWKPVTKFNESFK